MSENEGTEAADAEAEGAGDQDRTVEVNVEDIVARVQSHDEALGAEVRALVQKARELNARVERLEAANDVETTTDDDVITAAPAAGDGAASTAAGEDEADADAAAGGTGDEAAGESADGETAALRDRVAELEAELAETRAELEETRADLEETESALDAKAEEVEDLTSRLKRKQADFQNYKKRAKKRQDQIKDRATEDLVERLIDVRDNLKRGLAADHENVESLEDGIRMTLREFDRILQDENVSEIDPDPGDEVDPADHAVMMRVESTQPEGRIHEVYKPGYRMADKVIQEAQVTVSNGEAPADEAAAGDEADDAEDDGESDGDDEAVPLGGEVESDDDQSGTDGDGTVTEASDGAIEEAFTGNDDEE